MVNFIEATRMILGEFPDVHITSGLSNISYGIPNRRGINMQFLCLAMNAGMDSAIMDPTDPHMQMVIHATDALLMRDYSCVELLKAYREGRLPKKPSRRAGKFTMPWISIGEDLAMVAAGTKPYSNNDGKQPRKRQQQQLYTEIAILSADVESISSG
jgi:hypothetical protein